MRILSEILSKEDFLVLERDFINSQDFILSLKINWTRNLYPKVRKKFLDYEPNVRSKMELKDVSSVISMTPDYKVFAWCERHFQKMKYSGAYGLHRFYKERHDEEECDNEEIEKAKEFCLPEYYQAVDIHQQPGGIWSESFSGLIYERGARTTTPMLGDNHKDLHHRFAEILLEDLEEKKWEGSIVDLGCGFGKSTRPIAQLAPKSSILALDLSKPCINLAREEAKKNKLSNITFNQADARLTNCKNETIDLATSTMLLHEMPESAIVEFFAETFRILKHGGRAVHLDFWLMRDAFDRFIFEGHSWRNNEPFMSSLFSMDLPKILTNIGFVDIEISSFAESENIEPKEYPYWRFPWTKIGMYKPK